MYLMLDIPPSPLYKVTHKCFMHVTARLAVCLRPGLSWWSTVLDEVKPLLTDIVVHNTDTFMLQTVNLVPEKPEYV